MTIVAVNGGGNTPNGNAAGGTSLGEVDDEMLAFPSAHAGESRGYLLTSVQHAATDTSYAEAQNNSKQLAIDAIHYGRGIPAGNFNDDAKMFGQPVTFTATIHNPPGFAGGVFVASGDMDGSQNNLEQLEIGTIHHGGSPLEGVTDGTSNTVVLGEGLVDTQWVPVVGDWNDYWFDSIGNASDYAGSNLLYQDVVVPLGDGSVRHMSEPGLQRYSFAFDGSSQTSGDDGGIAWVSGAGGTRGADTAPEADWLLL